MQRSRAHALVLIGLFSLACLTLIGRNAPAQALSGDAYALLAEITDSYILSANSQDPGKYHDFGNFNPDVTLRLQSSRDPAVQVMIPVVLDLDAIRFKNDLKIVNGKVYEKVPGSRAKRPVRDFDPMVERALPGLQLPFHGDEVRLAISNLRSGKSDSSSDSILGSILGGLLENQQKGEQMSQINGLLETGLRRRLHYTYLQMGASRPVGGRVPITQEKSDRALPTIENTGSRTLHHCFIVSRIQPDARTLLMLGATVQMIDDQANVVFPKGTVDMAKASANLALQNGLQEHGDLVYVPELAPGECIRLCSSSTRLARSMAISFFSDETNVKDTLTLQNLPARGGRPVRGAGGTNAGAPPNGGGFPGGRPNGGGFPSGRPNAGGFPGGGPSPGGFGNRYRPNAGLGGRGGAQFPAGGGQSQANGGRGAGSQPAAGGGQEPAPAAASKSDRYNIFIGDASGDTPETNGRGYIEAFLRSQPGMNAQFFPSRSESDICAYIKTLPAGSKVNLVGHGTGADTAAAIALHFRQYFGSSASMNLLLTVGPISDSPPDFQDLKRHVAAWVNVMATPDPPYRADLQAWSKGRWAISVSAIRRCSCRQCASITRISTA